LRSIGLLVRLQRPADRQKITASPEKSEAAVIF